MYKQDFFNIKNQAINSAMLKFAELQIIII